MASGSFDDQLQGTSSSQCQTEEGTGSSSQFQQTQDGTISSSQQSQARFHCPWCRYAFSAQLFFQRHLKRSHSDLYWQMVQDGRIDTAGNIIISGSSITDDQTQMDSEAACGPSTTAVDTASTSSVTVQTPRPLHGIQQTSTQRKRGGHACTQCDRTFDRLNNLTLHRRVVHAGERPFGCRQCEQSFSSLGQVKAHKRSHATPGDGAGATAGVRRSGEHRSGAGVRQALSPTTQVFTCAECPYAFVSAVYLYRHLKCSHSDVYWQMVRSGQVDPLACQQVRQRSAYTASATAGGSSGPMQGGHPEDQARSYPCPQAAHHHQQQFTSALARPGEVRAPRQLKPYMCVRCDVCFPSVFDLKTHRREHHRTLMSTTAL